VFAISTREDSQNRFAKLTLLERFLKVPFLLRKIRKAKWYKNEGVSWIPDDELQADALSDIATKANELSVYSVKEDKSDLDWVIAALATTSEHLSNFDYALIDTKFLDELNIIYKQTDGTTMDDEVNQSHFDIIELTASKLLQLAYIIKDSDRDRYSVKKVAQLIVNSIENERINRQNLKEDKPDIYRKLKI
jgi:hypothetical protein